MMPIKIDKTVTIITPISIAPGTFLTASIAIKRKPSIESKVSALSKSPMLIRVASFGTIMPPYFSLSGEAYWSLANLKTYEFSDKEIINMESSLATIITISQAAKIQECHIHKLIIMKEIHMK